MQAAGQVTEREVPLQSRVAWLRSNYSYFEDEHKDMLMAKLDALTKTSGKKVCSPSCLLTYRLKTRTNVNVHATDAECSIR